VAMAWVTVRGGNAVLRMFICLSSGWVTRRIALER